MCTLLLLSFEDLFVGWENRSVYQNHQNFLPQNHQSPRFVGCDGGLCACESSKGGEVVLGMGGFANSKSLHFVRELD